MYQFITLYIKNRIAAAHEENGYTLLEYCAGAAVIAGIVWVALQALGTSLTDLLTALSEWAGARAQDVRDSNTNTGG